MIQRTPGVSTTGITGKLLALADKLHDKEQESSQDDEVRLLKVPPVQKFLQTSQRIANF